jgi:hypothetical protein
VGQRHPYILSDWGILLLGCDAESIQGSLKLQTVNGPEILDDVDVSFKDPFSPRPRSDLDLADHDILVKKAPLVLKLIIGKSGPGEWRDDLVDLILIK